MDGPVDATAPADRAAGPGVEALRRVDWRFLVDRPGLGRVALDGPADPALRAGLAATSTEVVALDHALAGPGTATFDVAVVVAPSADRLDAVARRCPPGAWVFAELAPPWRRLLGGRGRRACGPRAAARVLRDAGLEVERRWHWPSFDGALELVPLGDAAAFKTSLRRRRSRRARAMVLPVRIAARLNVLAELVPSASVVARRPRDVDDAGADAGFATVALGGEGSPAAGGATDDPGAGSPAGSRTRAGARTPAGAGRPLVLTPRFPASRHVVILGLDGQGRLTGVAKAPRRREEDDGLRREAAALERIAAMSPSVASGGAAAAAGSAEAAGAAAAVASASRDPLVAPRSLGLAEVRGWPVLVETALPGPALGRAAIRAERDRWVRAASDLAVRLALAGEPLAAADRLERLVASPLRRLAGSLPPGDAVASLAERTVPILAGLATADLSSVLEHGDLAPPNLLVTPGGGLAAIDWELAEPSGLPGHDLALFLHFAAVAVASPGTERDPDATGDAVEAAFAGPSPWAAEALGRHLEAIGTDPGLALPLALAAYARMTASMPVRAARPGGGWLARDRHAVAWSRLLAHLP